MEKKQVEQPQGEDGIADVLADPSTGIFPKFEDFPGGLRSVVADFGDAAQEELYPLLPVATGADRHETVVVFGAVLLEVMAEVEERQPQDATLAEKESDEQAPDAAIAVEEWVDRLELRVGKSAEDEHGHGRGAVEEKLELPHGVVHVRDGRRNERGLGERASARTDPVLRSSEFARFEMTAAHAAHEPLVDLFEDAEGERELADAIQPVVHRRDVVDDFFYVLGMIGLRIGLEPEDVFKRALGVLDLRAEDRLVAHIHGDEEIGIRKCRSNTVEATKAAVRFREKRVEFVVTLNRRVWRQRGRDEGAKATRLGDESPRSMRRNGWR